MVIPNLMTGFYIDVIQAEYIAEIRMRNINKEYLMKRINEKNQLEEEMKRLNNIIKNEGLILEIICDDLERVSKKYGKPRKTEIIYEEDIPQISEDNLIEDYGIHLFLTKHSYFKKITNVSLNASLRTSAEHKLKEDDEIIQEIETTNKSDILFFSDKFNVYKMKAYDMNECKTSSMGDYLANVLGTEEDENIIYIAATTDYSGYMLFFFENGKAAKIEMKSYETKVNRKRLINAYSDKSKLIAIKHISQDTEMAAVRDNDKAMIFNTALISSKSTKNSGGIQIYTLKKNSKMTKVIEKENFDTEDPDYYHTDKIPSTGHFLSDRDAKKLFG
ncbi:MAG: topoisomerase IV, partial [Firmicutes bacterium]|nr:topoisomerase IV [Bacillota bacterium]